MRPGQAGRVPGAEWLVEVRGRATPRWQGTQGYNGRVRTHSVGSKGVRMAGFTKAQMAQLAELVAGFAAKPATKPTKRKAGKVATAQRMFQERGYKCLEPKCDKGFRTLGHYTSPTDWTGLTGHKATAHKS